MMLSKDDVAASVILYNSSVECIDQISSYISQVSKLYIIDNSEKPNLFLVSQLKKLNSIEYFCNDGNKGVADALNKAAGLAIRDGFSYLLTMDDDSRVPDSMVAMMLSFVNDFTNSKLGIVSVAHHKPLPNTIYKYVNYTMTSGSLLNLSAYQQAGPFDNQLFIDYVDHEYSLRLRSNGYTTVELADLKLDHRLGTEKKRQVFNRTISFVSHSPRRLYYLVRNGIYIVRKYITKHPIPCLALFSLTLKEIIKSLLIEDNRSARAKYLSKAVSDGFSNKMGKLID